MCIRKKQLALLILLPLCLMPSSVLAISIPIEMTMSSRQSVRNYTSQDITEPQLLEILRAGYGTWENHRSVPKIGTAYSLTVFAVNATGSYRFIPESNQLVVHDLTVNKDTISAIDFQGYVSGADTVLIPVWNQTTMDNLSFASAEVGCFAQNVYLVAANLGIGTVSEGGIRPYGLRDALHLPSTMIAMLLMPLGYPAPGSQYPAIFSPDYSRMNGNLPLVQNSSLSLADALSNMLYTQTWSSQQLSTQELSQVLWAGYGYSSTGHITVPSAFNIYALRILISNATGVYQYTPATHSVTQILTGDKRLDLANAFGDQTWAANAPALFLIVYDSALGGEGDASDLPHGYMNINAGTVIQNILLEGSAWDVSGNVLSTGLEDWNGTGAEAIRNILALNSSLIPLYAVPVGHEVVPEIGYNLNIHVKDWDLADNIQGAIVYKDSDIKTSDANGWANWTDVTGTVEIKVSWFGQWVNGTFPITMDGDKTVEIQSNIFDVRVTCVEQNHQALLQNANVTVIAGGDKVTSGITGADGAVNLINVPNGTLTFITYNGVHEVISNSSKTVVSEGQEETLTCNQNYISIQTDWRISAVKVSASILVPALSLPLVCGLYDRLKSMKKRTVFRFGNKDNKQVNCK